MKVKVTFVGQDLIMRYAGEILPADAYDPETLQQLVSSGLVEQDPPEEPKKPEPKPEPKKAAAKKTRR